MKTELITIKQDITTLKVDAIVNAVNKHLLGGGGVDGAIHRVAGHDLYLECKELGGCETGQAKITKGYNLPAKYVIHTAGPIYNRENGKEAELLASCYENSLKLAVKHNIKTIAFPSISTGAFGYPIEEASEIAVKTIRKFLAKNGHQIEKVYFVAFSYVVFEVYERLLKK